jgi:putative SOS response-associated peptidase YedK
MCGRYSIVIEEEQLRQSFGPDVALPDEGIPENYNVAPTQNGLVLTDEAPHQLANYRWGLVPFWADDLRIGSRMINARSEGIESKPSFRQAIRRRRCLVIGDSFYEWKRVGKNKQPYRITPQKQGDLLIMAGIWEIWRDKSATDAPPIRTYSIITCPPNLEMKQLHNRMPVLLNDPTSQSAWLDRQLSLGDTLALLSTPVDHSLRYYPVSAAVGNVRNNGPDLHLPAAN